MDIVSFLIMTALLRASLNTYLKIEKSNMKEKEKKLGNIKTSQKMQSKMKNILQKND